MKTTFFALFALLLVSGCSNTPAPDSKPSQFTPTGKRVLLLGCEDLKLEVKEHNRNNTNDQKVADC